MLVALTEKQEPFVLHSNLSHAELRRLKEEKTFFCPQCGEPLQMKLGTIKMPHFAHYSKSQCESRFSEGETFQHLQGKQQLYELFKTLQLFVELEPYLKDIQQRPDLLIVKNNTAYAIEFQCSSINGERFIERNQGYVQKEIVPIWIPLTPIQKVQQSRFQKITVSHQLQLFRNGQNQPRYIMTYHPSTKQFYYFSNLLHLNGISFISKISQIPLLQQHFPFYQPKPLTTDEFSFIYKAYHQFIKEILQRKVLLSRKGVNDLFLRSLYELRLNFQELPNFLRVPVFGSEVMKECAVEWQTELLYFLHLCGIRVNAVNEQTVAEFLRWSNRECSREILQLVLQYANLLKALGIENAKSSVHDSHLKDLLYRQFLATEVKY